MSVMIRIDGSGGKIHECWAMYSLRMSFCIVPPTLWKGTPCFSATARYMAKTIAAGPLIVIEVVTLSSGIPSKRISMSFSESMATPHIPTSPLARGESESYPMSVGKWNAVESPVWPCERRNLNRAFVSSAEPNPANCRIVHNRPRYIVGCTPRVYGYCPGYPRSSSYSKFERGSGVYRRSISSSETVENRSRRGGDFRRLAASSASCHFFRRLAIPASFFLSYIVPSVFLQPGYPSSAKLVLGRLLLLPFHA